jgi:shikimate dehydrogenase
MVVTVPFSPHEDAPVDAALSSPDFYRFVPLDVTAGDVRFAGATYGSGPAVVLLHGFPQTHVAWRFVAPALADRLPDVSEHEMNHSQERPAQTAEADFPNGALRLFGLLGDPVSQVRAPFPVTQCMRDAGANAALLPFHVPVAHLASIFASLRQIGNLDGLVITVPHKVAMAGLVEILSPRAQLVGAVNLARREPDGRWRGEIMDGVGFARGLAVSAFDPAGREALVIGAGGAGSAVAVELARAGAFVRIFDVSAARASALAGRLQQAGLNAAMAGRPEPAGAALVVNATPLGMRFDDPMPMDPALLDSSVFVAEVVMKPAVTRFLQAAADRGCRTQLGEAVMLHQLPAMVDFLLSRDDPAG